MAFIDGIKAKAKEDKKIIVLPESKDRRVLIAAAHILEEGLADLVMVGNEEKIMDGAGWLEIDLTGLKVEDPTTSDKFEHYVEVFTELRAKKGMTREKAREILLSDYITYAVMMLKCGDADGVVAGPASRMRFTVSRISTPPSIFSASQPLSFMMRIALVTPSAALT